MASRFLSSAAFKRCLTRSSRFYNCLVKRPVAEQHPSQSRIDPVNYKSRQISYWAYKCLAAKQSKRASVNDGRGSTTDKKGQVDHLVANIKAAVFKCDHCETLCVKRVGREPYEKGVVMARCCDCGSLNLLVDNLDFFAGKESMQKFLAENGVNLRQGAQRVYELMPEDVALLAKEQETADLALLAKEQETATRQLV